MWKKAMMVIFAVDVIVFIEVAVKHGMAAVLLIPILGVATMGAYVMLRIVDK